MGHATEVAHERDTTAPHSELALPESGGGQGLELYLGGHSSDRHRETWRRRFYASPADIGQQRLSGFLFDPLQAK